MRQAGIVIKYGWISAMKASSTHGKGGRRNLGILSCCTADHKPIQSRLVNMEPVSMVLCYINNISRTEVGKYMYLCLVIMDNLHYECFLRVTDVSISEQKKLASLPSSNRWAGWPNWARVALRDALEHAVNVHIQAAERRKLKAETEHPCPGATPVEAMPGEEEEEERRNTSSLHS